MKKSWRLAISSIWFYKKRPNIGGDMAKMNYFMAKMSDFTNRQTKGETLKYCSGWPLRGLSKRLVAGWLELLLFHFCFRPEQIFCFRPEQVFFFLIFLFSAGAFLCQKLNLVNLLALLRKKLKFFWDSFWTS